MAEENSQSKRYNVSGIVANLAVRKDRNERDWISFNLVRPGKPAISCVAFGEQCEAFLLCFAEGSRVRLFGYFEKRDKSMPDGRVFTFHDFNVLWSGVSQPARQPAA